MFKRSFAKKDRVGKVSKPIKRSFNEREKQKILEKVSSQDRDGGSPPPTPSAIATIVVGREQRLFAAHEDILSKSPFFAAAINSDFFRTSSRRIYLPDEEPQVFSAVLEYLYKDDYYPRLQLDKRRNTWGLEQPEVESPRIGGGNVNFESTVFLSSVGDRILRDTAVYCAAGRYNLDRLQQLALRKQGLQSGIEVAVILRSARYAYDNTPDSDSRLRAHYLALIIRSRKTFKRSGTMQMEMENGGKLFFDLFVAMCNHMDDMADLKQVPQSSISSQTEPFLCRDQLPISFCSVITY